MLIVLLIFCLIFGIFVIVKSGDLLIDSSLNISECTGLSQQFIGATLLSFATTAPELFVSCIASSRGSSQICINNGMGSIICNIGLVSAISLIALNQQVKKKEFNYKAYFLLFSFVLLFIFSLNSAVSKAEAIMLLIIYIVFLVTNIMNIKSDMRFINKTKINTKQLSYSILLFIVGAVGVALSANLLVTCAQKLATQLNISEGIIAVTVLALGTALPELVATLTAIRKKTLNMALGNIIGANVMNCTLLVGLSTLFSESQLILDTKTKFITIPFCILFNVILTIPILIRQKTFKIQGFMLLFTFFVYYFLIFILKI